MKKVKGITPIIAILVILILTIAIASTAYYFITVISRGYTSKVLEIKQTDCNTTHAIINFRNIGTDTVTADDFIMTRDVLGTGSGACLDNPNGVNFGTGTTAWVIQPGQIKPLVDGDCDNSDNVAIKYTLQLGGTLQDINVNC